MNRLGSLALFYYPDIPRSRWNYPQFSISLVLYNDVKRESILRVIVKSSIRRT